MSLLIFWSQGFYILVVVRVLEVAIVVIRKTRNKLFISITKTCPLLMFFKVLFKDYLFSEIVVLGIQYILQNLGRSYNGHRNTINLQLFPYDTDPPMA